MIAIMLPPPFHKIPKSGLFEKRLASGGLLFAQGDDSRGPWWIAKGAVRLVRQTKAGLPVCLHVAHTGEMLAEASLFSQHYHCDAEATSGTCAVLVDRRAVVHLMRSDADFACDMARALANQVQSGRFRVALRRIRRAEDRVLAAMAELGPPDRIRDFAEEIGLTPEATNRALSRLVAQGHVRRQGHGRYLLAV